MTWVQYCSSKGHQTPNEETTKPMSSERLDVTHSHEEFSCPNIRGWFCGWSFESVRGRRSLSYSRMIGRIIVVRICWTRVALRCFACVFFNGVGGTPCFFCVSCLILLSIARCKSKCSVPHVPNDDIHKIPFSLKAGASVRCGNFVSFFWGWQSGCCVMPDVGNRDSCGVHRMKLVEWIRVRCNNARIRIFHFSLPAQVISLSRRSLYEVGCGSVVLPFVFRHMIWVHYCSSKGHQRHTFTEPHDPCPLKGGM